MSEQFERDRTVRVRFVVGWVNEVARFLLEIAVVAALGWWGWSTPDATVLSVAMVVLLPLAVLVVWALFGAPRRSMFPENRWIPVGLLWFLTALAGLALVDLGHPSLAVVLVVLVVVNDVLIQLGVHTPHRPTPGPTVR